MQEKIEVPLIPYVRYGSSIPPASPNPFYGLAGRHSKSLSLHFQTFGRTLRLAYPGDLPTILDFAPHTKPLSPVFQPNDVY